MRSSLPPTKQVLAPVLVVTSGFLGGAVFLPGLSRAGVTAGSCLAGGLIGSLALTVIWLIASALLAGRAGSTAKEMSRRLSTWFALGLLPLIMYFPYMYYRTGLEGDSVELPPLDSRSSVILLLLWSLLLLAVLLHLDISTSETRLERWISRHPEKVLITMMVVWLVIFFPLDVLKDQYMHTTTINSAFFKQSMLHVFDARGLFFGESSLGHGATLFATHINAIFFFITPIFRIWPDYRWLLFISDVALVLSAIPAYYLARRYFAAGTSLLLTLMVLLHPIMAAQPGRSDFSEIRFAPVLILTMFYFFQSRRFWLFVAFSLMLMTIREDMSLIVAFVGIYALLIRRSPRWVLTPIIGGVGYFAAANFYLLPLFNPQGRAVRADVRYSALGSSGSEILKTIIFKPWKAIGIALSTPSHIGAVYGLALTFGLGIPLLSGAVLLAITPVSELLFQSTTTLVNFMALPTFATLMIAFILGLARLDRFCQKRWLTRRGRAGLTVGVVMFFLCLSVSHTWFNPGLYRPRYNYNEALEAFQMIPDDASIMLPEFMLVYGKPDQALGSFHQITYQLEEDGGFEVTADYVLIDLRIPERTGDNRYYNGLIEVTEFVSCSPDYSKVFERNDIALYVRKNIVPANDD
ncbi:hypothetical protein BMS3Abin01_00230 [bacterium BMS3Abin01]|nr:hypothetical protein BMS3Abin01_00230 [bacterium BMS3Abin01]